MNTKEALKSFELDARLFYDAVTFSTDDYLYIIDMSRDTALVSDNMREDFGLPDSLVPGLIPLWRDLIVERDRVRFDESIDNMLSGKTDVHDVEYQIKNVDDENIWVVCRGLMKRDEHNDPTMFAGVVTCLERKGKVDSVTGLFTHDECVELLDRLIGCESEGGVMLLGLTTSPASTRSTTTRSATPCCASSPSPRSACSPKAALCSVSTATCSP